MFRSQHILALIFLLLLFACSSTTTVPKRNFDWRYMQPGEGSYNQYFDEESKLWIQMHGY
jgi:outer membrane biogenesis lipoprotein LolB